MNDRGVIKLHWVVISTDIIIIVVRLLGRPARLRLISELHFAVNDKFQIANIYGVFFFEGREYLSMSSYLPPVWVSDRTLTRFILYWIRLKFKGPPGGHVKGPIKKPPAQPASSAAKKT